MKGFSTSTIFRASRPWVERQAAVKRDRENGKALVLAVYTVDYLFLSLVNGFRTDRRLLTY